MRGRKSLYANQKHGQLTSGDFRHRDSGRANICVSRHVKATGSIHRLYFGECRTHPVKIPEYKYHRHCVGWKCQRGFSRQVFRFPAGYSRLRCPGSRDLINRASENTVHAKRRGHQLFRQSRSKTALDTERTKLRRRERDGGAFLSWLTAHAYSVQPTL